MALLTACSVIFHTNDDDKDSDTVLSVFLEGPQGQIASVSGITGHFDDNSTNGPFNLALGSPTDSSQVPALRCHVHIDPNGHDTWKFNCTMTCTWADGGNTTKSWAGQRLDQDNRDGIYPF